MGSPSTARRRYRLRTLSQDRNPQKLSSQETPGTSRPRTRHRDTTSTAHRYRLTRRRMALFICVGILGTMNPTAAHAVPAGRCPQYEELFKKYDLPVKTFSMIAARESHCNPHAISAVRQSTGRPDVGLFQIQASWATVTRHICHVTYAQVIKALTQLDCQLRVAHYLWQDGKGAGNWSVRSHG